VTDFLQDFPEGVIVAMDQMSLYFQATTTRVWAHRRQTPTLRVSPQRDHVHFYAGLNVLNGHEMALTLPEQTNDMTVHFLEHVQACYPNRPLLLLWDRAQWHKGQPIRDFLIAHPCVQMLHFPPGCLQFNPQEPVWERARDAVSHNHTRWDFPKLVQAFRTHLETTLFPFDWIRRYAPPILFEV
jgi:DDE superfamily endonuclease